MIKSRTVRKHWKILLKNTLFWHFDANAVTWWERSSRSIEVSPLVIWSSNTSYMNRYWDTFETRHLLCPRSHRTVPKTKRQEYTNIIQAISLAPNCFTWAFCNILLGLTYHRRALFFLLNSNLLQPLKMHLCDPRHHGSERLEHPEWKKWWLII